MLNKAKKEEKHIDLQINKEKINAQNEMYENTLNTVHAMAVMVVKNFGRLGYQIKLQEQILDELKKLNKGK